VVYNAIALFHFAAGDRVVLPVAKANAIGPMATYDKYRCCHCGNATTHSSSPAPVAGAEDSTTNSLARENRGYLADRRRTALDAYSGIREGAHG